MAEEKQEAKDNKDETAEAGEVKKKRPKKLFFIIGGVVLLLIAIGVPVLLMSKKTETKKTAELEIDIAKTDDESRPEGLDDENEFIEGEEPLGAIYPLETFVLNLKGDKFIRVQIQIEFAQRVISTRFFARLILIRDKIISLLSSKGAEDLQGPKEKEVLKAELKDAINEVLKKEEVKRIYFSQFVIQ